MRSEIFQHQPFGGGPRRPALPCGADERGIGQRPAEGRREEPPEGVLFLLTADPLAGVLPTIRSRCISFAMAPRLPCRLRSLLHEAGSGRQGGGPVQ